MKKLSFFIVLTTVLSGCFNISIPAVLDNNAIDVNVLKENDRTWKLAKNQTVIVSVDNNDNKMNFNEKWYLVHEDWIKTFNENQDLLIEYFKESKNNSTNKVSNAFINLRKLDIR